MDEYTKGLMAKPLTAEEQYIRTFTAGDTVVRVMYTGNTGWLNVSVRIAGVLRYSESHSSEEKAMRDFAERASRVDLAVKMAASVKATQELDAEEEAPAPVLELAALAEEMMEHPHIDRTYILEALIADLRGGHRATTHGLKALYADRMGQT